MRSIPVLLICLFALEVVSSKSKSKSVWKIRDADKKMKTRTLVSVTNAVGLYKEALAANPDDPELQLKTADAINAVMRIRTNANTILIEGSLDTPENKAIWAEQGKEVQQQKIKSVDCRDVNFFIWCAGISPCQISVGEIAA